MDTGTAKEIFIYVHTFVEYAKMSQPRYNTTNTYWRIFAADNSVKLNQLALTCA